MSIIETALSRHRRPEGAGKVASASAFPPASVATRPKISIPVELLRERGAYPPAETEASVLEQFRRVKRSLLRLVEADLKAGGTRVPIVVTSANQGDGKTFCSIGLALSLALEQDFSVVLIDGDPYVRATSAAFGVADRPGFLDLASNASIDPESLIVETDRPGLLVLPAGATSPLASELAASERARDLLARIGGGDSRRILILDCPPLLATTEALSHATRGAHVMLILRDGQTPRHSVDMALDTLAQDAPDARVSLVLNHARASAEDRYYEYGAYGSVRPSPSKEAGQ